MNRMAIASLSLLLLGVTVLSQPLGHQAIAQETPIEPSVRHAPVPWRPIGRDSLPGVQIDPSLRQSYDRRRDESLARAYDQLIARHAGDTRFAQGTPPALGAPGAATQSSSTGSSSPAP